MFSRPWLNWDRLPLCPYALCGLLLSLRLWSTVREDNNSGSSSLCFDVWKALARGCGSALCTAALPARLGAG